MTVFEAVCYFLPPGNCPRVLKLKEIMALSWKLEINTPKGLLGSKIPTIHFYYSYLQKAILQVLKLSESLIKKILSTGV